VHLERLLHRCEEELTWLDMNINFQKSCCLCVGPRCDVTCAVISSSNGRLLPWVTEMRYLGVFFTNSKTLKCSLDAIKRGFTERIIAKLDVLLLRRWYYTW